MLFVERNKELDLLDGLFAKCARGRGQIALITGGMATGKTELLNAFTERAVEAGAVLLTATGARAERHLHLGVLGQLFHGGDLPEAVAQRVTDVLSEDDVTMSTPSADLTTIEEANARVVHGLCSALLELASDHPVVLAVDDVQFADRGSLQALLYLQRRIRSTRVLVVLTQWTSARHANPDFHSEITRQPNTTAIKLAPLSVDGVGALLAETVDTPEVKSVATVYHAVSGGNPLLARALVDDYVAAGGEGEPIVGSAFTEAVVACLHRWDGRLLDAATGLAVLGEHASLATLERLLDLRSETVTQAVDSLETAGVLDGGRFRHPAARAAVLDGLGDTERGTLHHGVAELLHQDGANAATVAQHLIEADRANAPWAVGVLRVAAKQALADDDVDAAVGYLELAKRSTTGARERADIIASLARVEWRRNPSAAARHLDPLRSEFAEGTLDERSAIMMIKSLLWHGQAEEAQEALGKIANSSEPPRSQPAAELRLIQKWLSPVSASAAPAIADDGAAAPVSSWVRASSTLDSALKKGSTRDLVTGAEHVLQSCRLGEETLDTLVCALKALIYADRYDLAAPWCEVLLNESASRKANTWRALFSGVRAEIALRQGDLPAAAKHGRDALSTISAQSWGVAIGSPMATLLLARTALGDEEGATELVRQTVPEATFRTRPGLRYLHARGKYHLSLGRLHAALGDFQQCGDLMREWDIDQPTLAPWRADAAQAHLRLGNRDKAKELVAEQLNLPGGNTSRTRGTSLRVLAAASELKHRPALLRESVDLLQASGDRLELAHTLADLSHAHHALGEFKRARMMARRAMHIAKGCQAQPLYRTLSAASGETGDSESTNETPTEGVAALSDAERRVAMLAAQGHTNREIGRKLYITVSTVEQHLTRVYRKLKVTRRTDLPTGLPLQAMTWEPDFGENRQQQPRHPGPPSPRVNPVSTAPRPRR
ncbi:regulatory LuxR family protein [Herbihabitans rhizosphaerae]|uniref:Regulatory LuxR family protein n=1 Tax=Herbihabitans rhizosphaerae TaxID=1872711 RepID=A0A4Q7KJ42_9PSEU|nr:helix-turn-helix transcriptional regulator [Herbihabitans rhizosphaerae]RZS36569.1 regulatory LuxR family protein [Herbihabitans rhizosphaerae]